MADLRVPALAPLSFCVLRHDRSQEPSSGFNFPKSSFQFHDRRSRGTIATVLRMSSVAISVAVSILTACLRGRSMGSPRSMLYVCAEEHIMIPGLRTWMLLFLGMEYRSAVSAQTEIISLSYQLSFFAAQALERWCRIWSAGVLMILFSSVG